MLLGARYPTNLDCDMAPALGVFPEAVLVGHWNELEMMRVGLQNAFETECRGVTLVGIDSDAALISDGSSWRVAGRNQVHVLGEGGWSSYQDGDEFELSLLSSH